MIHFNFSLGALFSSLSHPFFIHLFGSKFFAAFFLCMEMSVFLYLVFLSSVVSQFYNIFDIFSSLERNFRHLPPDRDQVSFCRSVAFPCALYWLKVLIISYLMVVLLQSDMCFCFVYPRHSHSNIAKFIIVEKQIFNHLKAK